MKKLLAIYVLTTLITACADGNKTNGDPTDKPIVQDPLPIDDTVIPAIPHENCGPNADEPCGEDEHPL